MIDCHDNAKDVINTYVHVFVDDRLPWQWKRCHQHSNPVFLDDRLRWQCKRCHQYSNPVFLDGRLRWQCKRYYHHICSLMVYNDRCRLQLNAYCCFPFICLSLTEQRCWQRAYDSRYQCSCTHPAQLRLYWFVEHCRFVFLFAIVHWQLWFIYTVQYLLVRVLACKKPRLACDLRLNSKLVMCAIILWTYYTLLIWTECKAVMLIMEIAIWFFTIVCCKC